MLLWLLSLVVLVSVAFLGFYGLVGITNLGVFLVDKVGNGSISGQVLFLVIVGGFMLYMHGTFLMEIRGALTKILEELRELNCKVEPKIEKIPQYYYFSDSPPPEPPSQSDRDLSEVFKRLEDDLQKQS